MKTVTIKDLKNHENEEVKINGWVYNRRSIGKVWFLILRDGFHIKQIKTKTTSKLSLIFE